MLLVTPLVTNKLMIIYLFPGFDVENLPEEEMKSFFSKAGVSETQLQDQATRQFIYDFINTHGGFDAVKEELHEGHKPSKGNLLCYTLWRR